MTTVTQENQDATASRIPVVPEAISFSKQGRRVRVPYSIPAEQEYYWHHSWQEDERAALAEREAGDVFRFDSDDPEDAARFLDEGDLDDDSDE